MRAVSDSPAAMASYFDEHDCEPLDPEPDARTNMLLELARSLFNRMDFEDLGLVVDWDHHLPPPAAKTVVENLPRTVIRGSQAGSQAAAEAPTGEPSWSHVHMRRLGLSTGPPQHLPLAPRIIKGFFTHLRLHCSQTRAGALYPPFHVCCYWGRLF
uniref:Ring finger protein 181 n=1 Tax=Sus scrofa TaxID=9823 RepID=A0A8D0VH19_PIG